MNKFKLINIKNLKNWIGILGLTLSLVACKAAKVKNISAITAKNTAKEIIKSHKNQAFVFKTLQARMRTNYSDGKNSFSPTISLRMQHNEKIWLSVKILGITMAKALITPAKVSFYEKLNKRYYTGDFKALSAFLGTEVNFEMLQNLLTGQSLINLDGDFIVAFDSAEKTSLIPVKQSEAYQYKFSLYNSNIKLANFSLAETSEEGKLQITYDTYQKIAEQYFPEVMQIRASDSTGGKRIQSEFKSVTLDEELSFPFEIPGGYKSYTLN